MNGLASAIVNRGWAAWNIEYRRLGPIGGGGGWPASFDDVRIAVNHVARLPVVNPQRVVTCGHSAGGTFAIWAAHCESPPGTPGDHHALVRPIAAVSLAGINDLERAATLGLGNNAVARFLGGSPQERPEAYEAGSPACLLPIGVPQVLVHGLSDTVVPTLMSTSYQEAASRAGDDATYVPIDGLGHRELIDAKSNAWPVISANLEQLFSL